MGSEIYLADSAGLKSTVSVAWQKYKKNSHQLLIAVVHANVKWQKKTKNHRHARTVSDVLLKAVTVVQG